MHFKVAARYDVLLKCECHALRNAHKGIDRKHFVVPLGIACVAKPDTATSVHFALKAPAVVRVFLVLAVDEA